MEGRQLAAIQSLPHSLSACLNPHMQLWQDGKVHTLKLPEDLSMLKAHQCIHVLKVEEQASTP